MDFLLAALGDRLGDLRLGVHLLNLDLDIVVVDTTSTYWEVDVADDRPTCSRTRGRRRHLQAGRVRGSPVRQVRRAPRRPALGGHRDCGHPRRNPGALLDISRQRERPVDHPHRPRRPGIVEPAPADLGRRRRVRSAANRAYLTRGGGHYIHAEKLRHTNAEAAAALARPGRYHHGADNLRVKDVRVAPGGGRADWARGTVRGVPQPRRRRPRRRRRGRLIEYLSGLIAGSDSGPKRKRNEVVGSLRNKPGLRRLLRRTKTGLLTRSPLRRQVAAAHLRSDADPLRSGRRLQAAARRRTRAGATARAGLTQTNVSDQGAPSVETLRSINTTGPAGSAHACAARWSGWLQWESGSIDAILAGSPPTPTQPKGEVTAQDRFSLARQVVSLKATFAKHAEAMGPEAREALVSEATRSGPRGRGVDHQNDAVAGRQRTWRGDRAARRAAHPPLRAVSAAGGWAACW
jgi:hypothetical protein